MALQPLSVPPPNVAWVDPDGKPSLAFRPIKTIMDALQRLTGNNAVLIAVASPSNANAAAAGVLKGQLYCSTADPAQVYIRTV